MATKRTAAQRPRARQVVSGLVVNADLQTSAVFEIPNDAEEVTLDIQATNTAGAAPTIVTALQTSPDGGTTWLATGNQSLAAATGLSRIAFSRQRHAGQAAEAFAGDVPAVGAASAARNGNVYRKNRLIFRISAGASWTMNVWQMNSPSA